MQKNDKHNLIFNRLNDQAGGVVRATENKESEHDKYVYFTDLNSARYGNLVLCVCLQRTTFLEPTFRHRGLKLID
jgi:hypothetical protein